MDSIDIKDIKRLKSTLLSGVFWQTVRIIFITMMRIGVMSVMARLILPEFFGVITVALIIITFPRFLFHSGMNQFIIREINNDKKLLETCFTISILMGVIITTIILLLSPFFADFFNMSILESVLKVMALDFIIQSLSLVGTSIMQKNMKFRFLARISIISYAIGYGGVGIMLAWKGIGVWALASAFMTAELIECCLILVFQPHSKSLKINKETFHNMFQYSFGISLDSIADYIARQVDNFIVGRWNGAAALGYYSRAYSLMTQPINLLGQFTGAVLFSAITKIQNEQERLNSIYKRGSALLSLSAIPISVLICLLSSQIVNILFGPNWRPVTIPLQVLTAGIYFRAASKLYSVFARSAGVVYKLASIRWIYVSTMTLGVWVGHYYGINAVSAGVVFALTVQFLLLIHLSNKISKSNWRDVIKVHLPAFALGAIVLIVSLATSSLLKTYHQTDIVIIVLTTLAAIAIAVLAIRFFPLIFIGKDGIWWLKLLKKIISNKLLNQKKS